MSGHCLIGSGRRLSEKLGHEGRADREYIPSIGADKLFARAGGGGPPRWTTTE
jgi:hypothetical protein